MLLRRISEHVKAQNWFAVMLDFVIVVCGILIAFQITSWNESRQDKALELRYISELVSDLEEDQLDLQRVYGAEQSRVTVANYILQYALGETVPDSLSLPMGEFSIMGSQEIPLNLSPVPAMADISTFWSSLSFQRGIRHNRNAFDTLVGSGDFRVIRHSQLVKRLQTYHSVLSALIDSEFFSILTLEVVASGRAVGLSPFQDVDQNKLFELVRNQPELRAGVRQNREMAAIHSMLIIGVMEEGRSILELVAELYPKQ